MTAPLLRRLAAGLLILPLLFGAGCSDDKTEKPSLRLSAEKIVLPSEAGATARLDVTASGPWQLEISGSGFDASPLHGGRGTTSVTLTATETNTSTARTSLGSLHLFMPQSGPELTVTVEQRPAVAAQTLLLYMPGRSLAATSNRTSRESAAPSMPTPRATGASSSAGSPPASARPNCSNSTTTQTAPRAPHAR